MLELGLGLGVAAVQLAVADDALRLGADVDEHLVLVDAHHGALDDVTVLEAPDLAFLLVEQLLHRRRLGPGVDDGLGLGLGGRRGLAGPPPTARTRAPSAGGRPRAGSTDRLGTAAATGSIGDGSASRRLGDGARPPARRLDRRLGGTSRRRRLRPRRRRRLDGLRGLVRPMPAAAIASSVTAAPRLVLGTASTDSGAVASAVMVGDGRLGAGPRPAAVRSSDCISSDGEAPAPGTTEPGPHARASCFGWSSVWLVGSTDSSVPGRARLCLPAGSARVAYHTPCARQVRRTMRRCPSCPTSTSSPTRSMRRSRDGPWRARRRRPVARRCGARRRELAALDGPGAAERPPAGQVPGVPARARPHRDQPDAHRPPGLAAPGARRGPRRRSC